MADSPVSPHHVFIDSIGTASPVVSKVLADALQVPQEIILRALYSTPSVLVTNVEEDVAEKAAQVLTDLGLVVRSVPDGTPLPPAPVMVDVGIYLEEAGLLPQITKELSDFIGCDPQEALGLLLTDPCVVLGNVSVATATALDERLEAEVIVSNPRDAKYSLEILESSAHSKHQLKQYLNHINIPFDPENDSRIEDLDHDTSQRLWAKFSSTNMVRMVNQDFQRFEIVLESIDENAPNWRAKLVELTGMPDEIVDEVVASLPIQVEASVNRQVLDDRVQAWENEGLHVSTNLLNNPHNKIVIEEIQDLQQTNAVLRQFMPEEFLPTSGKEAWQSPVPMTDLMARFAITQLEAVGCEADYQAV